jgi:hypothetical protein
VPPHLRSSPLRDASIRRGALGVLFVGSVLLVQLPIDLLIGNAAEFLSLPWHMFAIGVAATIVLTAIAIAVLWLLPPRARGVAAAVAIAIGFVVWVQGNFLVGRMTVLNGLGAPVELASRNAIWTMVAAVAACAAVAFVVLRAPAASALAVGLLMTGLYVTTIAAIVASSPTERSTHAAPGADVYRVSSRENVLLLLLDGLQSDTAVDIIRGSESIERAFDGFQYYPDTAGVATTTFLSLPAIHSGTVYSSRRTPGAYFVDAIKRKSFMNRFAAAGFDTILLNPVESVCPARVRLCANGSELLETELARLKVESLQLFDLALFRASPRWLKRYIYNGGEWLTAGRIGVPHEIAKVMEGNELLQHLSEQLRVDDGVPTMKFVHSLSTHTPYVLNDDCRSYSPTSIAHLVPQARCGLLAVVSLLERLKAVDAYDNTLIVVMADHGVDPGVHGPDTDDPSERKWRYLAAVANPVFLIKPQGSRGPLREVHDPLQITDVGNMLCGWSRTCRLAMRIPPFKLSPDRTRRFNDYEWRQEFWSLRTVDNLRSYEIRGPVTQQSSWSLLGTP